jgi:hypothetical protein
MRLHQEKYHEGPAFCFSVSSAIASTRLANCLAVSLTNVATSEDSVPNTSRFVRLACLVEHSSNLFVAAFLV